MITVEYPPGGQTRCTGTMRMGVNASTTRPAKSLVMFVKDKAVPILTPVE